MRYLVTIDRNEYYTTKRREFYKPLWWRERMRPASNLGRTVFAIDREREECRALFTLPQLLDQSAYSAIERSQGWAAKAFTRGLRSVQPMDDGDFVISDIFGVYRTDPSGAVKRYVSSPLFADLHSGFVSADGERILVSSTGVEEIQEVGWDGAMHQRIAMPDVFGVGGSERVAKACRQHSDFRTIPIEIQREIFHVNWAEWVEEGRRLLISLYVPGTVALLVRDANDEWSIEHKWSYFPKCHAPTLDWERGTFLVALSGTNQVAEVEMESGRVLWIAGNILFGKSVRLLDRKRVLVGDCNGRRVVELDRDTGRELWSMGLPGIPYSIEPLVK